MLIVDDNEFNLIPLKIMIKDQYNIRVDRAENGKIAVDKYAENLKKECQCLFRTYTLIIMDINMPVMNGIEATKKIMQLQQSVCRKSQDLTHIVALTSYSNQSMKDKCLH